MKNGLEKRRAFRILERVYLKYEVLTERDFDKGLDELRMGQGIADGARTRIMDLDARLGEKLYVLKSQSASVAECLSILNDKLNILIDEFPALRETKSSLIRSEAQTCEVSAVGMTFAASEPLAAGTKLVLRLLFVADNRYIETFCVVARQLEQQEAESPDRPFVVAVEFEGMKPEQNDALIQHLLNRESETLRVRRLKQTQELRHDPT